MSSQHEKCQYEDSLTSYWDCRVSVAEEEERERDMQLYRDYETSGTNGGDSQGGGQSVSEDKSGDNCRSSSATASQKSASSPASPPPLPPPTLKPQPRTSSEALKMIENKVISISEIVDLRSLQEDRWPDKPWRRLNNFKCGMPTLAWKDQFKRTIVGTMRQREEHTWQGLRGFDRVWFH
jgi:hypothetical protein